MSQSRLSNMQGRHVLLGSGLSGLGHRKSGSSPFHPWYFVSRPVDQDLRGDRSLVLQAVRENGLALSHAAKATWGSMGGKMGYLSWKGISRNNALRSSGIPVYLKKGKLLEGQKRSICQFIS